MKKTLHFILTAALSAAAAGASASTPAATANFIETTQGLDIPMVFIGETTFHMGGTPDQGQPEDDETVHTVTLSPFYIAATEITQSQWEKVMGTTIGQMKEKAGGATRSYGEGPDHPMYYVSWNDAILFCRRLSALTGLNYRLPTEAEWELAARGGSETPQTKFAGSDNLDDVGWHVDNADVDRFNKGNPDSHPVTTLAPNRLGIFDMSGNVCEWVLDFYSPYPDTPAVDPVGRPYNGDRVYRGGAFRSSKDYCRVAFRNSNSPTFASEITGFRVVCEP